MAFLVTGRLAGPGIDSSDHTRRGRYRSARDISQIRIREHTGSLRCFMFLCDMTGLIARQGQTARSNPWTLHALWLRQLVYLAVVKRFLCFCFHIRRHSHFEGDAGADAGTRKGRGKESANTACRSRISRSVRHQPLSWEVDVALSVMHSRHSITIYTDNPGSLLSRITYFILR